MINKSETEERHYLGMILEKLKNAFQELNIRISDYETEIKNTKKYIWENISQLDSVEKAANRIAVHEAITFGELIVTQKRKITKLIDSPYFGRVDFAEENEKIDTVIYIGIHNFTEKNDNEILIYDWRAPVSSLFYDFETGPAYFMAPVGQIEGKITLKRQYKIKNSVMEYLIESTLNINDEVLQKELSHTSSEKMKNIVATIQREQNSIIRNEKSKVLIIQGVAGSGKTSIALHRVAFLLYRFKKTLTSKDILIISPNKVFGDYISNVLPELGEEDILDVGFEEIANKEITGKIKFQTFVEQVTELIDSHDENVIQRIKYKASMDFVGMLNSFLEYVDTECFCPVDIIDGITVSKEDLLIRYKALKKMPVKQRLKKMASDIIEKSMEGNRGKIKQSLNRQIKTAIFKMFKFPDTMSMYKYFFNFINRPELFYLKKDKTLEYADVFPYVYVKMFYEGAEENYKHIKHLLIDEMQDYTPIQYSVLKKLFHCKMTILGDSSQSVNPYSSSSLEEIKSIYDDADCVELCKSYRSTIEIMNLAQKLKRNSKLITVERHGEEPVTKRFFSVREQLEEIKNLISRFFESNYNSLGIVCKTPEQACEIYEQLKDQFQEIHLLNFNSTEFKDGIIVTTAHMAKGLEFDQVIIPFVSASTYHTDMDKNMLYIACTRAMHKLNLMYFGTLTPFLE